MKRKTKEKKKAYKKRKTLLGKVFRKKKKNKKKNTLIKMIRKFLVLSKELESRREKYKNHDKKVFSARCNLITASMVIMCSGFIYSEGNLFYAYPIVTCIMPFMNLAEGINSDIYEKYKDLKLYNKIIKINLFVISAILISNYEDVWFINFYMILIFLIPLILGNIHKEKEWDMYDEYE